MFAREIRYEQAVYGSFPFWHKGYAVLARSAGCRRELAGVRFNGRGNGLANGRRELPRKPACSPCRCARRPWMVVGVFPQGCDDQGRPGALAFHGLFVTRWSYWRAGLNPFVFAPALRSAWNEADQRCRSCPAGS